MSLETSFERIARALEAIAGIDDMGIFIPKVSETEPEKEVKPKKTTKKKTSKKVELKPEKVEKVEPEPEQEPEQEPEPEEPEEIEVPTLEDLRDVLSKLEPGTGRGLIDEFGDGAKSLSKVPEENRQDLLEAAQGILDDGNG